MKNWFAGLQILGKALMMPVAVLPAAALLLRLGAPDVFDIPFITKAGGAIFENLPLIFATGISIGIAKDGNGTAALSGVIGYLVLTTGLSVIDESLNPGILAGIVAGVTAGMIYNRYKNIQLPEFLGFFSGQRFVSIATSFASIVEAAIFGIVWSPCQNFIYSVGDWIIHAGTIGVLIFGFLNRILIPIGLHHILNSFVWFVFGEYTNPVTGVTVTGDLNRFFAGDPTAGMFTAGFFPVFMFGLPAAAFAMYRATKPEKRKKFSGVFVSMALTAFLTGITEPLEFSFMFIAPGLYFAHAVLTGLFSAITYSAGVLIGCGFSTGLIDYVLSFGIATHPERIFLIGAVCAVTYYFVFYFAILKFDLPTPGRVDEEEEISEKNSEPGDAEFVERLAKALGGAENLEEISNCVTRLRLKILSPEKIDESELKKLGAKGIIIKGSAAQIIFGLKSEQIANELNLFSVQSRFKK